MSASEQYTPGYSTNASNFMAQRRASSHAAYFLPHLKPGFSVLDCGCGPGTITLGLAEAVAPGRVVGIDAGDSQIAQAKQLAANQKIANVEFRTASVYDLPFAAAEFDALFSNALMEHLSDPVRAMREMRRVLKPGGVVGLSSPDWGGFLVAPSDALLDAAINFYKLLQQHNGGDPYVGRKLGVVAQQAGFSRVRLGAIYECYADLQRIADYLALRIEAVSADEAEQVWSLAVEEHQLPTTGDMAHALREWSRYPEGLFAQSWVTLIAWAD